MMNECFKYTYKVRTSDLWQASMYYAYSSYMGVVNLVFIVSSIVLMVSRWSTASDLFKALLVLLVLLFVVVQPVSVWLRSRASLGGVYPDLTLEFSKDGISVTKDGIQEKMTWDSIKGVVRKPTLLIVYTGEGNGYILRNDVLKKTKNDLYDLAGRMMKGQQ